MENTVKLFEKIIDKNLLARRINITASNVINEIESKNQKQVKQLDLFTDYNDFDKDKENEKIKEQEENKLQNVLLDIKNKYGKNAILKGLNLSEGSTTIDRNKQIGGHHE